MRTHCDYLADLNGTPAEKAWIKERLETLSVRESYALSAAFLNPPQTAGEAVECLRSLDGYDMCFPAGSYEQLGELYLHRDSHIPKDVLPYVDLEKLGQFYENEHPGLFVGQCYVEYPTHAAAPSCQEDKRPLLRDDGWSVKLKLASPAVPEGVWLRLPDHDGKMVEESDEVALALNELEVKLLEECTLLDAKCILPEAGNLMEQYDSVAELVRDGDDLGFALDERGQGEAHWMDKFAAALEYEDCHDLRFALDIARNIHCYEWVPYEDLAVSAEGLLLDAKVDHNLIYSGAIDLEGYKAHLLEAAGYRMSQNESGYIARNNREFVRDYTAAAEETHAPLEGGMTMQ